MASDLSVLKKWFKSVTGADFVALPAPTRSRYTTGDGRDDVVEELADRGLPAGTPAVFWHWQSHERAFTRKGELVDELYLHWQGPHAVVAARLAEPPEPFTVLDAGPAQAFRVRKPFPLPEPGDRRAGPATLRRLATAVATGRDLDEPERAWLATLAGTGDEDAFALLCDVDPALLPAVDDLGETLRDAWVRLVLGGADLARRHPDHPLAAAVLGQPAGALDTDADDALAVTAARLWHAGTTEDVHAAVAPWTEREHTLPDLGLVLDLVRLKLHPGTHPDVVPARLLDVAADERLPVFWRALAIAEVDERGGLEHLADRLAEVRAAFTVPDRPFAGVTGEFTGDRARLRAFASWHWPLGCQPTVLRTNPDRTRALASTVELELDWFWTWPAELAAFDADGRLTAPLPVHLRTATDLPLPPRFEFRDGAIHPGACPPLEDLVARFGAARPANPEDVDYVRATFLRYAVQRESSLDHGRAATLFDVWRTHDGVAGPVELLGPGAVRALVDEYYAEGGLAERSGFGNGYPFLPFAREGDVLYRLDMRHRIPPVLAGDDVVASSVDAFLGEKF